MSEGLIKIDPVSIEQMPTGSLWSRPGTFDDAANDEECGLLARAARDKLAAMPVPGYSDWMPMRRAVC